LLLRDAHVRLHVDEHGRLVEEALGERTLTWDAPSGRHGRALLLGDRDERVDPLELRGGDHRTNVGRRLEAATEPQFLGAPDELIDEPVRDGGCAITRDAAVQRCPDVPKALHTIPASARSTSA